jgi:hypothetical protein
MRKLPLLVALCLAPLAAPCAASELAWTTVVTVRQQQAPSRAPAVARYGPFEVLDGELAALVGITDGTSPAQFAAMLRDHPGIAVLEMVDCPGTEDDIANLRLGRMIRAAGLATVVPQGGSVRSGAVELFLAGVTRRIEDRAEFAVHAWEDESGREAGDYAPDAPENHRYLAYYREMGMEAAQAQAFYAMTNSARFDRPLWLTGEEMGKLIESAARTSQPSLAYLDFGPALP